MRNTYSLEFKAKVMCEVLREDRTLSQVAAAHGMHPNLVSQWRDQALSSMISLFSRAKETDWAAREAAHEQEKQELYAEINRLKPQLSWLKGVYCAPRPADARTLLIQPRIDEIYSASPFYGIRKITAQLHVGGLHVNHKAVARYIQLVGLRAIYPEPNLSKRAQQHALYPYLLRGLKIEQPNQVWAWTSPTSTCAQVGCPCSPCLTGSRASSSLGRST